MWIRWWQKNFKFFDLVLTKTGKAYYASLHDEQGYSIEISNFNII